MLWIVGFWATICKIYRVLLYFCWLRSFFYISALDISQTVTPKPIWKNSRRSFRCTKMFFQNCDKFFAVVSKIYKKLAIFYILMTITSWVNMITRKMTPFFCLLFKIYPLVYFIFALQDLQNSVSWGQPCTLCSSL